MPGFSIEFEAGVISVRMANGIRQLQGRFLHREMVISKLFSKRLLGKAARVV